MSFLDVDWIEEVGCQEAHLTRERCKTRLLRADLARFLLQNTRREHRLGRGDLRSLRLGNMIIYIII